MKMIMAIAAGGAVGAVARHFAAHWVALHTGAPWGIFAVNILGAVIMGALVEIFGLFWSPAPEMRAFLAVGILGSFTTFSTFALDSVLLLNKGHWGTAMTYMVLSVVLSVAGLKLGMQATKYLILN
ncbi:fluoride efflux transporter CrcB [Aestuariispira insulae]|uniref:Fluoride-specific ion channel FluC n=1 Tax=Aestuariispira insulae TaxID=1461337 RepID=A0A3D9HSU1_9PROT|nr:fluoride efflux transporter CrcB [Aestuariispira insulae]RED52510.1 camphor resistance protein CrcB [Aestuariispira insulae]